MKSQKDFKRIASQGRYLFFKELGIKWLANQLDYSRFAIIVSLKVDKKAVVRNRIKRRLREIVHKKLKKIKPGFDLMVMTRSAVKDLEFQVLKEKVGALLKKAKLEL